MLQQPEVSNQRTVGSTPTHTYVRPPSAALGWCADQASSRPALPPGYSGSLPKQCPDFLSCEDSGSTISFSAVPAVMLIMCHIRILGCFPNLILSCPKLVASAHTPDTQGQGLPVFLSSDTFFAPYLLAVRPCQVTSPLDSSVSSSVKMRKFLFPVP